MAISGVVSPFPVLPGNSQGRGSYGSRLPALHSAIASPLVDRSLCRRQEGAKNAVSVRGASGQADPLFVWVLRSVAIDGSIAGAAFTPCSIEARRFVVDWLHSFSRDTDLYGGLLRCALPGGDDGAVVFVQFSFVPSGNAVSKRKFWRWKPTVAEHSMQRHAGTVTVALAHLPASKPSCAHHRLPAFERTIARDNNVRVFTS
jgi:hypothetical protein